MYANYGNLLSGNNTIPFVCTICLCLKLSSPIYNRVQMSYQWRVNKTIISSYFFNFQPAPTHAHPLIFLLLGTKFLFHINHSLPSFSWPIFVFSWTFCHNNPDKSCHKWFQKSYIRDLWIHTEIIVNTSFTYTYAHT